MQRNSMGSNSLGVSYTMYEPEVVAVQENAKQSLTEDAIQIFATSHKNGHDEENAMESLERIYDLVRDKKPSESTGERQLNVCIRLAETTKIKRLMYKLAVHNEPAVRAALTENTHAPSHLIVQLSCDDHLDVRYAVADNSHSPMLALVALLDDENPYIAHRAGLTMSRVSRSEAVSMTQHIRLRA